MKLLIRMDNVHLVEMDHFNESELTPKRTKKKRKEKDCTRRGEYSYPVY